MDAKRVIHLKTLKRSWTRECTINLCFKDTKIGGQKHSTLTNHAVERHFNPFATKKNGAAARNVFVKRENEKRGRSLNGPFSSLPFLFSFEFPRNFSRRKNLLWQEVIARIGVVRERVLVTRCNPRMALNASSRSKL